MERAGRLDAPTMDLRDRLILISCAERLLSLFRFNRRFLLRVPIMPHSQDCENDLQGPSSAFRDIFPACCVRPIVGHVGRIEKAFPVEAHREGRGACDKQELVFRASPESVVTAIARMRAKVQPITGMFVQRAE